MKRRMERIAREEWGREHKRTSESIQKEVMAVNKSNRTSLYLDTKGISLFLPPFISKDLE